MVKREVSHLMKNLHKQQKNIWTIATMTGLRVKQNGCLCKARGSVQPLEISNCPVFWGYVTFIAHFLIPDDESHNKDIYFIECMQEAMCLGNGIVQGG